MLDLYRNLIPIDGYSHMEIENVIERGGSQAWVKLYQDMRHDPDVRAKVLKVATHYLNHPFTIRFHFWYHCARRCEAEAWHG